MEQKTTTELKLPVFVLEGSVLLPGAVARLETDAAGLELVRGLSHSDDKRVVVALSTESELGVNPIAALARVEGVGRDGGVIVAATGRVRVIEFDDEGKVPSARVEEIVAPAAEGTEVEALALEARRLARDILALLPGVPAQVGQALDAIRDPSALADLLAHHVTADTADKLKVLETVDPVERLRLVVAMLVRRREVLKAAHDIEGAVQEKVSKAEREHILRRKLEAIQNELGEGPASDTDDLAKKLGELKLPEDVRSQVDKELARYKKLPEQSPERSVARTWLQWIAELPWASYTDDNLEVDNARAVLDADHHGLQKVKKRVLQFLAVRKLRGDLKGPILCLVGPPGVGKTSLGQSIARAMGRKFVRVSLGGVRDEAEIRGHRRTYIGAFPGQVIQMMKKAATKNPVFLLDEVDKMSIDFRGDPSSALLEVLDPEQNSTFLDHYLDTEFDLSQVMFICTANITHPIPPALRDRMEILRLAGYTLFEKVNIAKRFLVPKQLKNHGLDPKKFTIEEEAIRDMIEKYTREAGVRNLERELASVCRKLARRVVREGAEYTFTVKSDQLTEFLGIPRYRPATSDKKSEIGIATGLAWTETGGEILTTEATLMKGRGKLTLTGKLGDVMQESAQAALSYIRSRGAVLGLDEDFYRKYDIHIHVPEGAIPKDGPSAGITMATALASILTKTPTRGDVAMTGEITLRGKVLPIGGVKEKVLAAHRLGIRTIILPRDNEKDLADIPEDIQKTLEFKLVETMDEVLQIALERGDQPEVEKEYNKDLNKGIPGTVAH